MPGGPHEEMVVKSGRFSGLLLAVSLATFVAACGGSSDAPQVIDLTTELAKATVTKPSPEHVLVRQAVLGGEEEHGLFMHPNSSAEFASIKLGAKPMLNFAIGLEDTVRDKPGDGVDFMIGIKQPDGTVAEVWSKYIDTRRNESDRGWQKFQVSLEKYGGQTVRLVLSTSIGAAGDSQFDWAFWGNPQLVTDSR